MPLIPPAVAQRLNTVAYFVFALILFAVGAAFVWAGETPTPDDDAAAKVFASDPSCAASLSRDLPAGECRTFDATVIDTVKRYHYVSGKGGQSYDDYVFLRYNDGTQHEGELAGYGDPFDAGDRVRVQQFRGEVVRIVEGGETAETMSAPDVTARAKTEMPWVGGALIAVALFCLFFGIRAVLRPSQPTT